MGTLFAQVGTARTLPGILLAGALAVGTGALLVAGWRIVRG